VVKATLLQSEFYKLYVKLYPQHSPETREYAWKEMKLDPSYGKVFNYVDDKENPTVELNPEWGEEGL
jgi:hypothetical protein